MRINHKFLRHTGIELAVTAWRVIKADDFNTHDVGDLDAVPHDGLHQLAVVLHDRGLAGVEAVGFGPAQTEADAQAAHFCGGVDCTRIFGDVEARNTDLASNANHAHQGVEYGGRSLVLHTGMAVTASFEAYGVNSAVHFRFAQQRSDLFVQWCVCRQVGDFKTLGLGVSQADRVDVTDDHHRSTQQASGRGSGQAYRAGTGDVHGAAWANARGDSAVVTGGQNVGEAGQVTDFFHGPVA